MQYIEIPAHYQCPVCHHDFFTFKDPCDIAATCKHCGNTIVLPFAAWPIKDALEQKGGKDRPFRIKLETAGKLNLPDHSLQPYAEHEI